MKSHPNLSAREWILTHFDSVELRVHNKYTGVLKLPSSWKEEFSRGHKGVGGWTTYEVLSDLVEDKQVNPGEPFNAWFPRSQLLLKLMELKKEQDEQAAVPKEARPVARAI
jgi:hypothetical protein